MAPIPPSASDHPPRDGGVTGSSGGEERRDRLLRRLTWLRNLEWANVPLLAAALLWWLPAAGDVAIPRDTWLRTAAYVPVAALLGVGGWYWHRKLLQLRGERSIDDALVVLDRWDRWVPWLLSLCGGALVLTAWTGAGAVTDRWWAAGLVVFAGAEYVNYFRIQLMHDTRSDLQRLRRTRRLRRSWLASDLADWRQRARAG